MHKHPRNVGLSPDGEAPPTFFNPTYNKIEPSHPNMNPSPIDLREVISSQIPALALLQNIGYTYITPAEALAYRQGKRSKIVLEDILVVLLSKGWRK
jgi:hypothetical protein